MRRTAYLQTRCLVYLGRRSGSLRGGGVRELGGWPPLSGAAVAVRADQTPLFAASLLLQRRSVTQLPTAPPGTANPSPSLAVAAATAASPEQGRPTPSGNTDLPSIEPVVAELRTLVTRPLNLGALFRSLSPASRSILAAHRLPLEELLLHLPNHFRLFRVGGGCNRQQAVVQVGPAHYLASNMQLLRAPTGAKLLPALVHWLGPVKAKEVSTPAYEGRGSGGGYGDFGDGIPAGKSLGTGFVDSNATLQDRLEELLTYIPNEWAVFTALQVPRNVKMRCMGYPTVRPSSFFLRYPQFFEVRLQDGKSSTFYVRRSSALQRTLREPPKS